MSNMILGGVTFTKEPTDIPQVIQKDKPIAVLRTYSSIATFEWDATYIGVPVTLQWSHMPSEQYASLLSLYLTGGLHTFNPDDGEGMTFSVKITSLSGGYFKDIPDAAGTYRQNVKLTLVIIAQQ